MPRKHLFLILFLEIVALLFHVNPSYAEPGTLKWIFTSSDPDPRCQLNTSPLIGSDGTIYIASNANTAYQCSLYAINPNGDEKWRYELPMAGTNKIALGHDNTIYAGFDTATYCSNDDPYKDKNKIIAINPDGTKKWEREFQYVCCNSGDQCKSISFGNLAIGPYGTIYIAARYRYCYNNCSYSYIDEWESKSILYAINPDGTVKWEYNLPSWFGNSVQIIVGPDETIYLNDLNSGYDECLTAIAWDGTKRWSIDGYFSSPSMNKNKIIYAYGDYWPSDTISYNGLFALDSELIVKWEWDLNDIGSIGNGVGYPHIIIDQERLYLKGGNLYAINSSSGENIWSLETEEFQYFSDSSPVLGANQVIYASTADELLHAINKDGNELWQFEIAGGGAWTSYASSPVIAKDGTLYIGSYGPKLYAINTESGGLANSDWPMFAHDPRHTNSLAGPDPDNDGIDMRDEDANQNRHMDPGETDPYNIDSDGDGIQDGIESGITIDMIGWDTDKTIFQPDLDPETKTNPVDKDTDDDGIPDGMEDVNHNGRVDAGETDPAKIDSDDDGIQDGTELGYISAHEGTELGIFQPDLNPATKTHPLDADTDNDGIPDGLEDINHNGRVDAGETDPLNIDTDNDGIQDGTERGYTLAIIGHNTDLAVFQPDMDPGTKTNPLKMDTDGDGLSDGEEDSNHNGRVDEGETDPNAGKAMPWLMLLLSD